MKSILVALFLLEAISGFSQTDTTTYGYVNGALIQTEITPAYPGGMMVWKRFLRKNLNYPRSAQDQNVTGKVIVAFTIKSDGSTSNFEIIKSLSPDLDKEAIRLIIKSARWAPAIQNGKQVTYRNRQEIEFPLPEDF